MSHGTEGPANSILYSIFYIKGQRKTCQGYARENFIQQRKSMQKAEIRLALHFRFCYNKGDIFCSMSH